MQDDAEVALPDSDRVEVFPLAHRNVSGIGLQRSETGRFHVTGIEPVA